MIATTHADVMPPSLSVIIVLRGRVEDVGALYRAYRDSLLPLGQKVEFIYVLDGPHPEAWAELVKLIGRDEPIMVLDMPRVFGEAACLREGLKHARAAKVLILPPLPAGRDVRPAADRRRAGDRGPGGRQPGPGRGQSLEPGAGLDLPADRPPRAVEL